MDSSSEALFTQFGTQDARQSLVKIVCFTAMTVEFTIQHEAPLLKRAGTILVDEI
jgi:hypothetical protein